MTIGLTTIPTETDGSLGRDKADQQAVPDLDHYVPAAEWNTVKSTVKDLADTIGTLVDPEEGTIEARLVSGGSTRVLCRPTAATATAGNLVSTTPTADAGANATISWGALSTATYRSGFIFTSAGATGTNKYSVWKLNVTMPATRRFVIRGSFGERSANILPILFFAYQDLTHAYYVYRNSSAVTTLDIGCRNNSTTTTVYSAQVVCGLNTEYGGDFELVFDYSAVASGPLGDVALSSNGTGDRSSSKNSLAGIAAPHASWASGSELTIGVGCSEITTTPDSTSISNLVMLKHPMDE